MSHARRTTCQLDLDTFMAGLRRRNPGEPEFHQAVQEVVETLIPFVRDHQAYREAQILERMTEPDRVVMFRVCWEDDEGCIRTQRAWRVQFNNAIGPYKGGLRFQKDVTLSVLKFLGFEQCFKNSLTGLPMGGAKDGSNFNPKGKSEREVMRFCHALMRDLYHHIGEDRDVPAGDIGVGSREIGYLFGQYKQLTNRVTGVLTGKGLAFGGSAVRIEASGYDCAYFCQNMLEHANESLQGKTVAISGSGNVAIHAAEKSMAFGAKVISLSDSDGSVHDPHGLDDDKLAFVTDLKQTRRGRICEYAQRYPRATFRRGARPWDLPCDVAMPCATQNELAIEDAKALLANNVRVVCEGANMPTDLEAAHAFRERGVLFGPGKAANAGGVAVSGLEQSQNAQRTSWSHHEVDRRLCEIMKNIRRRCIAYGSEADGSVDYVRGANVGGFLKVADAMLAYGIV